MAFAIGTVSTVDGGITKFCVFIIGGTIEGVEALLESGASGVFEGCTFEAGTGAT